MTLFTNGALASELADHTIELACQIQAIPAPTFQETQRAAFVRSQFHALGLSNVQTDKAGNVLARLPGKTKRPLVVSAHIDSVHPIDAVLDIRREADRVSGPGIGDNALGLAAMIALARHLQSEGTELPGDLWLVGNVGEEGLGDLRGMQAIVDHFQANPLAYIVLEGMGLGTILHRGLGVERYKIKVQTAGGHSWVDYGAPSAIHELCELVSRITAIPLPRTPCTTMNVGVIHGGISVNTIASQAWLELDLRSEDGAALNRLIRDVEFNVNTARRTAVTIQMERIGRRLPGMISSHHPLVELARETLSDLGIEARLDIASTDANLPLSRGYPSICLGITSGNHAHTPEEYILTQPVRTGMEQLYRLVTHAWEKLA
jgi:tripeptide aminopeptidase